jgi:MFS transporter, YNFM family, putative membrane transport protein
MIERGSAAFWRTSLAMFAAGLATFALLYCVQPLLPVFSAAFGISAAGSSLSLSATTLVLAPAMLVASAVSDRLGRKTVMVASLGASSVLCGVCALMPGFGGLVFIRALMGLAFSGLPSVAMAYLVEEMSPGAVGLGMGLYIGGSAIGGMTGRLLTAAVTQYCGWRAALCAIAALGLVCAVLLWRNLPGSVHFQPRHAGARNVLAGLIAHWRRPVLPWLFAEAFLLMGGFVSVYNYIAYRLLAPPYSLSQSAAGLIFLVYPVGVVSSAVLGGMAVRRGRRRVMGASILLMAAGLLVTLASPVWAIVLGVAGVTAGFFGAHSVASAWVGHCADGARAQASALYLLAYYGGSSVIGSGTGFVWAHAGWPGVVAAVGALLILALGVCVKLIRVPTYTAAHTKMADGAACVLK